MMQEAVLTFTGSFSKILDRSKCPVGGNFLIYKSKNYDEKIMENPSVRYYNNDRKICGRIVCKKADIKNPVRTEIIKNIIFERNRNIKEGEKRI